MPGFVICWFSAAGHMLNNILIIADPKGLLAVQGLLPAGSGYLPYK